MRLSTRWARLGLIAALAVAVAACGSDEGSGPTTTAAAPATTAAATTTRATAAPSTSAATTTTVAPAPVDLAAPGPFAVGQRTVTIPGDPARGRPLTVDLWYPAPTGTAGDPAEYVLLPGVGITSERALAAVEAAPGPFPLVVYSHGSGGLRYIAATSAEHLASWGFVVASPDHTGNTAVDLIFGGGATMEQIAELRPLDARQVIDGVLALSATAGDPLTGRVDASRIGIFGHSAGGYTAIVTATGATLPGGTVVPADPRVKAVAALAPASGRIPAADLARLTQPYLLIAGTADDVTPIDPNVTAVWDAGPGTPRYRIALTGVGHDVFTDICRYQEAIPTFAAAPAVVIEVLNARAGGACAPTAPPYRAVHTLVDAQLAGFFTATLSADADAAAQARAALEAVAPAGTPVELAP
jgi:predicted dienelactone hydrolase